MNKKILINIAAVLFAGFALADPSVVIETAETAAGFETLSLPAASEQKLIANGTISNNPLGVLTDGKLDESFGAAFGNSVSEGAYKMNLGALRTVSAVTSWSYNQTGRRGAQKLMIYGSNASRDPGWNLSKYTPLGTIDTTGTATANFTAGSLRAADGETLGNFRWIVWSVSPVSDLGGGENTAFQELAVETIGAPLEEPVVVDNRPNIVYLMTDDQRWDTLGCYGRPEFLTANIDKLADQGVIFDNVFHAVAICAPSRATIMTGRYFASHKSGFTYPFDVKLTPDDFDDSYPAKLREAGYRTGFIGKFGIYTQGVRPEMYFDYYAVHKTLLPKDDAILKTIFRADRDPKERSIKKGDALIHFLDTQPKGQPFCISVSFDAVKNDKDADMYGPHTEIFKDKIFSVPGNWVEGANETLPNVVKENARGFWLHRNNTSTPELYQKLARRFATQGYTVDQQVGRVMVKLEEMGVLDNTIVIYTSDNGRFHGSQGLFDKCILYDEAVKAPFIVYDGRVPKAKRGRRESALISSVDVAPTILSLANVDVPSSMQGCDISSILDQTQDRSVWRDAVFMENLFLQDMFTARLNKVENLDEANRQLIEENKSYRSRGVRTERFKYFIYNEHDPRIEELYNLEADPLEMNNLVSNPEYAEVLSKLRKQTEDLYTQATATTGR